MVLEPGARLGPYRIEALIGAGGFSVVYQARDDRLDAAVALKVMAENFATDPSLRGRFVDEARMIRKVASSSLVALYDVGETPTGQPYLVMELAENGDLDSRVRQRAPNGATVTDLHPVIALLSAALGDVHAAGLVHRDVKPKNLLIAAAGRTRAGSGLIDADERLLLADLGFAKDLEVASGYTSGGGTRWFQAPEQLPAVVRIGPQADIYSATAVLVWMLTGSVPTTSWVELLAARTDQLPHQLVAAITQGLAIDPAHRQQTIEEWQRSLGHATPTIINPLGPAQSSPTKRARFNAAAAAAAFGLALAGGAAGYALATTSSHDVTEVSANGQVTATIATLAGPIELRGPETLQRGEIGQFIAQGPEGIEMYWILSDIEPLPAALPLEITPTSTGTTFVTLQAVIEGQPVSITHDVEIQP